MVNHLLYLLLGSRRAEGGRILHRREVDGGLPELQYDVLDDTNRQPPRAEELLPDVVDPGHFVAACFLPFSAS